MLKKRKRKKKTTTFDLSCMLRPSRRLLPQYASLAAVWSWADLPESNPCEQTEKATPNPSKADIYIYIWSWDTNRVPGKGLRSTQPRTPRTECQHARFQRKTERVKSRSEMAGSGLVGSSEEPRTKKRKKKQCSYSTNCIFRCPSETQSCFRANIWGMWARIICCFLGS